MRNIAYWFTRYKQLLFCCLCLIVGGYQTALAQLSDKDLFQKFESHFALMDSLIFQTSTNPTNTINIQNYYTLPSADHELIDSLLFEKVEKQFSALKSETGLLISGQAYYRADEGFGIDDDDALSRYIAKVQVELRWNFLSSSLINRKSRIKELDIKGELERVSLKRERINQLIKQQKESFRTEYDSLMYSVLQLRIKNLQLLNDAHQYLVSDRSISTDELLDIMDDQAIAERLFLSIPKQYPITSQLSDPQELIIHIDTAKLMSHIQEHNLHIYSADLQLELLKQQEKSTNYWRSLNLSPFFRYSYYLRPEMRYSSNIDVGMAFQIPISAQESYKKKVLKAEHVQKTMEKEDLMKQIKENISFLLTEIERTNQGLIGEAKRIRRTKKYLELRNKNYQNHIGEYNFLSRIKEYNHYLSCWENFYSLQYKRDCYIAELQAYITDQSVLDFCTIRH